MTTHASPHLGPERPRAAACGRRPLLFATWGVLGVALTLLECVVRLGHRALVAVAGGLETHEWAGLFLSLVAFGYGEGYLALHKHFAPRVIARAFEPTTPRGLWLAPLHALGLVGGARRELARAWGGAALIVLAIVLVRASPSPVREIVDAGVACALLLGLVSIALRFTARVVDERRSRGGRPPCPAVPSLES